MDLHFILLSFFMLNGVFGDEVKTVSVMEGHNVTLNTDIVKERNDRIVWSYGSENTLVATINRNASNTSFSDDERFKDRLQMDNETGDLTIRDVTTQHAGNYTVKISRNKVSYKTFNITVYDSSEPRLWIIPAVLISVIFIIIIVIIIIIIIVIIKAYKTNLMKPAHAKLPLTDEERSSSSNASEISAFLNEEKKTCM